MQEPYNPWYESNRMIRYKLEDVTEEIGISKIISDFQAHEVRRFERLERYYHVHNDIIKRIEKDGKPNNRLAHGFAKYITRMATSYFMGKGVRFDFPDGDSETEQEGFKTLLTDVLEHNYTDNTNFEIAKEASKKGIAFEILFIDEQAQLRTIKLNAEEVIPIYSQQLGEFLECAIRLWSEWD